MLRSHLLHIVHTLDSCLTWTVYTSVPISRLKLCISIYRLCNRWNDWFRVSKKRVLIGLRSVSLHPCRYSISAWCMQYNIVLIITSDPQYVVLQYFCLYFKRLTISYKMYVYGKYARCCFIIKRFDTLSRNVRNC